MQCGLRRLSARDLPPAAEAIGRPGGRFQSADDCTSVAASMQRLSDPELGRQAERLLPPDPIKLIRARAGYTQSSVHFSGAISV